MLSHPSVAVTLVVIASLLGTAVSVSRKYLMKSFSPASIMYIDTIFTSTIILAISIFSAGLSNLNKDLRSLDRSSLAAFVGGSVAISISIFLGLYLLKYNDLGYLTILETGVEIIVAALVGSALLGEKFTRNKIIGLFIVGLGVAVLNY